MKSAKVSRESRDTAVTLGIAFLASRVLVVLAAVVAESVLPLDNQRISWSSAPILRSLTSWDAVHYLNIAAEGYHRDPVMGAFVDHVFFPLYPVLIRILSVATQGDLAVAGLVISNTATLAAMGCVYALGTRFFSAEMARLGAALLVISPGAVAFAMVYGDSLFLALAAGCLLAAERRSWLASAVLFAFATLTRLPGVALALPIAVLLWRSPDAGRYRWLVLAAGPIALVAFYWHLWTVTGDFWANLNGQAIWAQPDLVTTPAQPMGTEVASGPAASSFDVLGVVMLLIVLIYTFSLVHARQAHIPAPYIVLAVAGLLSILAADRLVSAARYLAVIWPFAWLQATRFWRPWWPPISAGLFMLFAVLTFSQVMAA